MMLSVWKDVLNDENYTQCCQQRSLFIVYTKIILNEGTLLAIAVLRGALQKINQINIKRHTAACPGLWETSYFLVKKKARVYDGLSLFNLANSDHSPEQLYKTPIEKQSLTLIVCGFAAGV